MEEVGLLSTFAVCVDVVLIGETVCVHTAHPLSQDLRVYAGYGLLITIYFLFNLLLISLTTLEGPLNVTPMYVSISTVKIKLFTSYLAK